MLGYPWPESNLWTLTCIKRLDFIQDFIGLATLKPTQKLLYRKGCSSVEFDFSDVQRLQILSFFCFVVFLKYFVCLTRGSTKNQVEVWFGFDGVVLMVNI